MFVAQRALDPDRAQIDFLQGEETVLVGDVLRHKRLFADRSEIAREALEPGHTAPAVAIGLDQFEPALKPFGIEHGADLVAFELGMFVIGIAGADTQRVDEAADLDLTPDVGAELLQCDRDRCLAMFMFVMILIFIVMMMMRSTRTRRHAVARIVIACGKAQASAIVDQRESAAQRISTRAAIGQATAAVGVLQCFGGFLQMAFVGLFLGDFELFGAQRVTQHIAADAQIVALAIAAVDMRDDLRGDREVHRCAAAALVRSRAIGTDRVDMEAILRHRARDAAVEDVDRAADRLAAEQEHGGAAQHFDALRRQRLDRHGVVSRGIRDVERAEAVGQHAHALALKTAQHRARRTRAERGGRHARHLGQRFADLAAHVAHQLVAGHHRCTRQQVEALKTRRADNHLFSRLAMHRVAARPVARLMVAGLGKGGGGKDAGGEEEGGEFHGYAISLNWICANPYVQ